MSDYFGGSTEIWVPDNLKSGVDLVDRYEPGINRTYEELATHYGAVVVPARVFKPKDKAKVESAVQVAQRWILAVLRHRTFFSLAELNEAIWEKLEVLNARPMQKLGVSRRELYERLDRPVLKPLPQESYELSTWKRCRVNIDYHVEVENNLYSVPYQLIHEKVEARVTASVVEVLFKGKRVASHPRKKGKGHYSTNPEHMPRSHREHLEWTPSRLLHWAEQSGRATGRLVAGILESRPHPEQGFRSCLGVMRLGSRWGSERLEAACARAEALSSYSYRTVKNILSAGLDRVVLESDAEALRQRHLTTPMHERARDHSVDAIKTGETAKPGVPDDAAPKRRARMPQEASSRARPYPSNPPKPTPHRPGFGRGRSLPTGAGRSLRVFPYARSLRHRPAAPCYTTRR